MGRATAGSCDCRIMMTQSGPEDREETVQRILSDRSYSALTSKWGAAKMRRVLSEGPSSTITTTTTSGLLDRFTSLFPLWVVTGALLGALKPGSLTWFNGGCIEAALCVTMVCMGCTLTLGDFRGVFARPQAVLLGLIAQFSIMPCMGWLSAKAFNLPPAAAAGTILVGCCPGGTASNLVVSFVFFPASPYLPPCLSPT